MAAEVVSWSGTSWRRFTVGSLAFWFGALTTLQFFALAGGSWPVRTGWLVGALTTVFCCGAFVRLMLRPALALEVDLLEIPTLLGSTWLTRGEVAGIRVLPGALTQATQACAIELTNGKSIKVPGLADLQDSESFTSTVGQIARALDVRITGQVAESSTQPTYVPGSGYRVESLSTLQRLLVGLNAMVVGSILLVVTTRFMPPAWSIAGGLRMAAGVVILLSVVAIGFVSDRLKKGRELIHLSKS